MFRMRLRSHAQTKWLGVLCSPLCLRLRLTLSLLLSERVTLVRRAHRVRPARRVVSVRLVRPDLLGPRALRDPQV